MRVTSHNGRWNKNGVYSPRHNDRNFDQKNASHIDPNKNCFTGHIYQDEQEDLTFEEVEMEYYKRTFTQSLTARNERYRKSGHKERMKSMDEYRKNKLSCPEETILQVGNKDETIDVDLFEEIIEEHLEWQEKTFPNAVILNVALHADEQGAPHVHMRRVWVADTKDGKVVNQTKALEQMGIERPDTTKKKTRYNNPKMTFTQQCREHLIKVCQEHGLDLELEPAQPSKKSMELDVFLEEKIKKEVAESEKTLATNQAALERIRKEKEEEEAKLEARKKEIEKEKIELEKEKAGVERDLENKKTALKKAETQVKDIEDKSDELEALNEKIEIATDELGKILESKVEASKIKKPFYGKQSKEYSEAMIQEIKAMCKKTSESMKEVADLKMKADSIENRTRDIECRGKDLDRRERAVTEKEEKIAELITKKSYEIVNRRLDPKFFSRETSRADAIMKFMSGVKVGDKTAEQLYYEHNMRRIEIEYGEVDAEVKRQKDSGELEL